MLQLVFNSPATPVGRFVMKAIQFVPYGDYLQSQAWEDKRQEAFNHYGRKCMHCPEVNRLTVHHWTYANFGNELLCDLGILCKDCHDRVHAVELERAFRLVKRELRKRADSATSGRPDQDDVIAHWGDSDWPMTQTS